MGTLLGLVAFLMAIGSIITAFKPSLIRQRSRFKAFVLCWMGSILATMVGSAVDGAIPWSDALTIVFCILVAYWSFGRFVQSRAIKRAAGESPDKKSSLHPGPVFSKKGNKPAPAFSHEDEVQNILNDPFFSEPDTPAAPKATRNDAIDRFEQSLTTLWAGYAPTVEFTYVSFDGERSRRQVDVDELAFNDRGQFYLRGYCHKRLEQRTFKVRNIETKLKAGSRRYEFEDWCVEVLGLPVEVIDDIQSLQDA